MTATAWMLWNKHSLLLFSISRVQTPLWDKQKTDGKKMTFFFNKMVGFWSAMPGNLISNTALTLLTPKNLSLHKALFLSERLSAVVKLLQPQEFNRQKSKRGREKALEEPVCSESNSSWTITSDHPGPMFRVSLFRSPSLQQHNFHSVVDFSKLGENRGKTGIYYSTACPIRAWPHQQVCLLSLLWLVLLNFALVIKAHCTLVHSVSLYSVFSTKATWIVCVQSKA